MKKKTIRELIIVAVLAVVIILVICIKFPTKLQAPENMERAGMVQ